MRAIVAGCRYVRSLLLVEAAILLSGFPISEVVSGGNGTLDAETGKVLSGTDLLAEVWALSRGIPVIRYPAFWTLEGKSAGPRRNRRMANDSGADALIAIWDGKSRGTKSMIKEARSKGLPVFIYKMYGDGMLYLSPEAAEQVKKALDENNMNSDTCGVRLGVKAGGCSGLSYQLDLVAEKEETDRAFYHNGVPIYCPPKAYLYLKGTTINYEARGTLGGAFSFDNPNAARSCGCGTSFTA